MRIRFFLLASLALFLYACGDSLEDYNPPESGADYFPLQIGNVWTYQLDSVVYDNNGLRIDTFSLQVRETITEEFIDQAGKPAYRVARAHFNGSSWITTDIWSAGMDEMLAFRTEENLRFAKLSFPITLDKSWDGNAYIDEDVIVRIAGEPIRVYQNWGNYSYTKVGQTETINGMALDDVSTVLHVDLEDKITRRYSIEKYAKGMGLVYKKMIILNTQKFDSEAPWDEKAEEGFILEQYLISFEQG